MISRKTTFAFSVSLCFVFVASAADVVRTADPIKRGMQISDIPRMVKVLDNVYTYEDYHSGAEKFTTTNMIVITKDGVFLADAQGSVDQTKKEVEAIAKITSQPIKYVCICSDHGDHRAGNNALPAGVTYLVHPNSKAIIDKGAASPRARPDAWKLPADAVLVPDKKVIKMGGEEIQVMFLGRGHTSGDLVVYLPKEKVLYTSELSFNRVFPAMVAVSQPTEWLQALDKAEKLNTKIIIAGHGFTEDPKVSKEEFENFRKALKAVIDESTRLYKAGVPLDDAIKQANWGEYKDWTLSSSQGPGIVRQVYAELSGKLNAPAAGN